MKINILALGVAALTMTGCSESFLDTTSKTELNSTSFYKTEVQAEYAVVGCYDGYQRTVSNGNWPSLFQAVETMSDDCLGGGGPETSSMVSGTTTTKASTAATSCWHRSTTSDGPRKKPAKWWRVRLVPSVDWSISTWSACSSVYPC